MVAAYYNYNPRRTSRRDKCGQLALALTLALVFWFCVSCQPSFADDSESFNQEPLVSHKRLPAPSSDSQPNPSSEPQTIAPGIAQSIGSPEREFKARLAELDRAILLELVTLSKFNVHFHLEANHHQKWRAFTYPVAREAGTALSFAATILDISQQARGLDNPARINRNQLKKAVRCGITGNAISGTASALELAQNSWVMWKAQRNGYSPGRSMEFVRNVVLRTDKLLSERAELVATEPSQERRQVLELEERLVKRIRQQLLFEFTTWSCHSRDQAWRENTFYTLDSLQSFTRMGAGILTSNAFRDPRLSRPAVITALVSNSVATANPIVSNFAGVAIRKYQEKRLSKHLPVERPKEVKELQELVEKVSTSKDQAWLKKVGALTARSERMDVQLTRETREIERYRQIAQQQTISGPIIGLAGVTSSTLATIAVYGHRDDLKTATRLGFAGRITQGTGQLYALINTPYTVLGGMVRNRRLRRHGELPEQLLAERLKRLEAIAADGN